jgi:acyl-CoA thioester hydrolase
MSSFHYYHPIEVRYGDLDPQGHVNNAKYMTYMEQARISYVHELGLWKGGSFDELGIILADMHITYLEPVVYGQPVRVGVRISRLGNKSLTMEHSLEDAKTGQELAKASTVLVAYDYKRKASIPIPTEWREKISRFETLSS